MLGFQALSFWIGSPYFFHHTVRVCLHAESNIMCIAYIFIGFLLIAHFVIAVLVIVASVVVVVAIFGPKFCMRCTHTRFHCNVACTKFMALILGISFQMLYVSFIVFVHFSLFCLFCCLVQFFYFYFVSLFGYTRCGFHSQTKNQ